MNALVRAISFDKFGNLEKYIKLIISNMRKNCSQWEKTYYKCFISGIKGSSRQPNFIFKQIYN
jgi:hypothetical protein